ncbi:flavodoxin family protein [bacterium]|nr:flavodoxin family protein [bacterium]
MKKILGIVGSPRKNGNTHILVSKILEGAENAGACTELIFLNDLSIQECDGCHVCWKGQPCCKNDDMNGLYPKIIESDVIVFGTPVYWYGPSALMKGFIDRFVYFNCPENRAKIRGKSAVIAVPFEDEDPCMSDSVEYFFKKCFQYLEMKLVGKIFVPGVTHRGEIMKKDTCLERGFELGRRLVFE